MCLINVRVVGRALRNALLCGSVGALLGKRSAGGERVLDECEDIQKLLDIGRGA